MRRKNGPMALAVSVLVVAVVACGCQGANPRDLAGQWLGRLGTIGLPGAAGAADAQAEALLLSGTIEAEEIVLAAEVGGRVAEVAVDEGQRVASGAALVRLDTALLERQREQAEAVVRQAEAALDAARAQLAQAVAGARQEELAIAASRVLAAEAGSTVAEAQREAAQAELAAARGQQAAAESAPAVSQAQLRGAQAALDKGRAGATVEELAIAERAVAMARNALWGRQVQRDTVCGRVGVVTTQADCDAAKAAVGVAEEELAIAELRLQQARVGLRPEDLAALEAALAQARAAVEAAQGQLETAQAGVWAAQAAVLGAQANEAVAQARLAETVASQEMMRAGARSEEIEILEAQMAQAQAAADGARAALEGLDEQVQRMTLRAPLSAEVIECLAHVGELAAPGIPLVVLADLSKLTLTVYIPEPEMGRVRLDQAVSVTVDAYDDTFEGRVAHIASRAEFTPKNVETRRERVNKVFAVEIAIDNADGRLLPGMPADTTF